LLSFLCSLGGGLRDRLPLCALGGGLRERLFLLPLGLSLELLLDWLLEFLRPLLLGLLREGELVRGLFRFLLPVPLLLGLELLFPLVLSEDLRSLSSEFLSSLRTLTFPNLTP
jgi:hypothetical protein